MATASKGQQSPGGKTKNDDGLADGGDEQPALNPEDAPTQSLDITVDSERKLNVLQVSTTRSGEFSSDKIAKVRTMVISVILFLLTYDTNMVDQGSAQWHTTCGKQGGDSGT